jgi:hypothetical protein
MAQPSLLEVHGALSALAHAVSLALDELNVDVQVHWRNGTYLSVTIETTERRKQLVIDRLMHGALAGGYDYRFTLSYPTMPAEPYDRVIVTAYPDMHHDHRRMKQRAAA